MLELLLQSSPFVFANMMRQFPGCFSLVAGLFDYVSYFVFGAFAVFFGEFDVFLILVVF